MYIFIGERSIKEVLRNGKIRFYYIEQGNSRSSYGIITKIRQQGKYIVYLKYTYPKNMYYIKKVYISTETEREITQSVRRFKSVNPNEIPKSYVEYMNKLKVVNDWYRKEIIGGIA